GAGAPGRADGDQLGAAAGQLHVQLGEPNVVAGGEADDHAVDLDGHRREPGGDGAGLGEAERVVEVDLVVTRIDVGSGGQQGVGDPAVGGGAEHAGHHRHPGG